MIRRTGDVSRLEGFSDAVFGFAITLLVVSLDGAQELRRVAEEPFWHPGIRSLVYASRLHLVVCCCGLVRSRSTKPGPRFSPMRQRRRSVCCLERLHSCCPRDGWTRRIHLPSYCSAGRSRRHACWTATAGERLRLGRLSLTLARIT